MNPYLSVIIPTYNRVSKLRKTLHCLEKQSLSREAYEIIVVDDGSTDETPQFLKSWREENASNHALHQKNSGQGVARNKAIKEARGQILLFIGDDIYGNEDFLLTHARFHEENPEENAACLGLTNWDSDSPVTPFMGWLTRGGPQFAYHKLVPQKAATFWFFYTSNLSLKKILLQKEAFDESFKGYGWEDIELGYRLEKKHNLKLIYTPKALAFHEHPMEESGLKNKMLAIGKTAKIFQKLHPEVGVLPHGFKKISLLLFSSWPSRIFFKALSPLIGKKLYWSALSKHYFLEGIKSL